MSGTRLEGASPGFQVPRVRLAKLWLCGGPQRLAAASGHRQLQQRGTAFSAVPRRLQLESNQGDPDRGPAFCGGGFWDQGNQWSCMTGPKKNLTYHIASRPDGKGTSIDLIDSGLLLVVLWLTQ